MGNTVFFVMFWLLVAVLIISTALREKNKKAARQEKIRRSFGSTEDTLSGDHVFDQAPSLLEYMRQSPVSDQCLDDITVKDLELRDVYRRINRCVTSAGESVMYCLLRLIGSDGRKGADRYSVINAFIGDRKKAVTLLCILDGYRKRGNEDEFELLLRLKDAQSRSIVLDIVSFWLLCAAVISAAFYPLPGLILTVIMIAVCIAGYFAGKRHMDANLQGLALSLRYIRCAKQLNEAGCEGFEKYSPLFGLLKANWLIAYKDGTNSDPLRIIFDYVRMITHVDLITYSIKVVKVRQHIDELGRLYRDIGELDCMLALASYLAGRDHCRAEFTDDASLDAQKMYHPLVSHPVTNDIDTECSVLLTGSNASGKSTFLKAIGLNQIFAASFGFAFAASFKTSAFCLYTSMALTDDLLGGQSYYVVEAGSIKRICDAARDERCLCIIDEIFRGTNTTERIAASTQVLRFLCAQNALCFAATHDKELTELLYDDMDMYHFTEEINGDSVTFPFILQRGVSTKTNAITILSMLGFDDSIVSSAKRLALGYEKSGKWSLE